MERIAKIGDFLKRDLRDEELAGAVFDLALGNNQAIESYFLAFDYLDFQVADTLIDFFVIDDFPEYEADYIKAVNNYKAGYTYGMMNGSIPTYQGVPLYENLKPKEAEELKRLIASFYESLKHLNDNLLFLPFEDWTDEDLEILGLIPEAIGPLFNRPVTLGLSDEGEEYLRYFEDVLYDMIRRSNDELIIEDVVNLRALFVIFEYTLNYEIINRTPVFIPRSYYDLELYTDKLMIKYEKKAVIYNELIS